MSRAPNFRASIEVDVNINAPWFADLLVFLGGSTIAEALSRIEDKVSDLTPRLDRLEATLNAFDQREAAEDEQSVLDKAEITRLKTELADLQTKVDANTATPEEQARFEALLTRIDASNKVPSEVLPDAGGATG